MKGPKRRPVADRFWEKVDKTGDCWLWTGAQTRGGYGNFGMGGHAGLTMRAPRAAVLLTRGSIPDGMEVDHLCRVRLCVRPDHLEVVTREENNRRRCEAMRNRTECPKGHPMSGDNLMVTSSGRRRCRTCIPSRLDRNTTAARPLAVRQKISEAKRAQKLRSTAAG